MKKFLSLLLALALVLGLCACSGSGENQGEGQQAEPEGLQVGYAKINITPDYSVGLSGYSNASDRPSNGFVTYIYATCIAVTEGEETILMITLDNIAMEHKAAEQFRSAIMEKTGIPGDKIFFGATHSHSCPEKSGKYMTDLTAWMT